MNLHTLTTTKVLTTKYEISEACKFNRRYCFNSIIKTEVNKDMKD